MAEHLGPEILYIVRDDDAGFGPDRRGDNMSVLPLRGCPAHAMNGIEENWQAWNIGDRKGLFHFAAPIFDFIKRDPHAGMEISHPLRMDIVGPNWFERLRFGEVQK
jgi:hypothetical protein